GLSTRLYLPPSSPVVQIESADYPHLQRLVVDLSNASFKSEKAAPKASPSTVLAAGLHVDEFQFLAQPLLLDSARMFVNIEARHVDLKFARDSRARPMLLLTNAAEGNLRYRVAVNDLATLLRLIATEKAAKHGLPVRGADLTPSTPTDHH